MEDLDSIVPQDAQRQLVFFVNGKKVVEHSPDPEWTLLWYLRRKLHLTGTKYGCGEGGCGACTVMVSQYLKDKQDVRHIAVNACLAPVCSMHGLAVATVEGIGTAQDRLHPVQERIAKAHGSQCGFCTPGIVMSMYTLLRKMRKIEYIDIETALQGNLCRCTGYRPILDGFKTFMEGWEKYYFRDDSVPRTRCAMGRYCCRQREPLTDSALFKKSKFIPYDPTQEPIFPPELKVNDRSKEYLYFKGKNVIWIRPTSINELLLLKHKFPHSKIVVGNTEIGVEVKFKKKFYKVLISPVNIASINFCKALDDGILVGAAYTLTELYRFLAKFSAHEPKKGKIFDAIKDMLHWFAGQQVRNVASLVGNIITASPISDLNPILMSTYSILNVCSLSRGNRKVFIDEYFFTEYRQTVVEDDEVILSVEIPYSSDNQHIKAYKQARRRDDDISIVTASFNITFDKNDGDIVQDAKLCFGGMAPTTILAKKTSALLKGQKWNEQMLHDLFCSLTQELQLDISVPGGMADYRKSLCLSFFYRFYSHVLETISQPVSNSLTLEILSAINEIPSMIPKSSQCLEIKDKISTSDAVGQPVPHTSAIKQATGEALYCDDVPYIEGELFLCLVFSKEPFAKIISIDASDALALPGVKAFFSAEDLDDECNKMGPIIKDEEIFSKNVVTSRACVIGAIVAVSESIARKAKDMVEVNYQRIEPVIITIEDAIMYNSFYPGYKRVLKKGDVKKAFEQYSMTVEGTVRSGAQEHFYLETISAYAIRKEDELEIISTTQNPADIARIASEALQIPNHKISCTVKRIGGGFGGKETRAAILAIPVAIAAYKLKKPVRAVLDRDEDMQVAGYRHPCLIKYKAAYDGTGKIIAAVFDFYANAGNSMDISCSMIERAIMHVDNCYFIPNIEVNGYLCKTNLTSNTAFRGFGAPKAMLAAEYMIRNIAEVLDKSYEDIVEVNLYREGQITHFNQTLTYCTVKRCWDECIETSKYWERKKEVEEFNISHRWKKKGIALVPTKYGISFQADFLMQAGALLHVYRDGSVLLSIGGVEMGQGLFTKMIQVATRCLDISMDKIHISEMSTDKVPNSSPTAGSISSDIYGMAVINACDVLNDRLKSYKEDNSAGTWEEWVNAAYFDRIQLTATGFYAAPKIEYNPKSNKGNLYEYFTYGVACSEVLIDCLTGDHKVLRTDIVMDVGESLNPAIDIGQIEGAFLQGYGFYTMEEMVFSPSGEALTRGPGAYKIPTFSDIPREFNVCLLKGAPNPRAVYSSKAVGEPPLFLAASVFFAIKEAIQSARRDAGVLDTCGPFTLDVPATCARIRMGCEDHITRQVVPTITKEGQPWNVIA